MKPQPKMIYIGTSGWSYQHWKGIFYPPSLKNDCMLDYYAYRFNTVEINNSFYQLPKVEMLKEWRAAVPRNFVFAVKASQYITHRKKLKDGRESTLKFFERIEALQGKLGPILFQLPPKWRFNSHRLEDFVQTLSSEFLYAFELRDRSWLNAQTYDLLSKHQIACCIYDLNNFTSPLTITAGFVYVRLHGPVVAYQGSYDLNALAAWANTLDAWASQGRDVYFYFNNDQAGYAVQNARRLKSLIDNQ